MSNPSPTPVATGFKDWRGHPIHMLNQLLHTVVRPVDSSLPWSPTNNLVIVRDDIFEGTVHVPASLKTGTGPQIIGTFQQASNYGAYPNDYNVNLTAWCAPGATPFIGVPDQRIHYTDWRIRSVWNNHGTLNGFVIVGQSFGGRILADLAGQLYRVGSEYIMSADFTIGYKPFLTQFQIELGFGGHANAIATTLRLTTGSDWPAFSAAVADAVP